MQVTRLSSALVRANPHKPDALEIAKEVESLLESRGVQIVRHPHNASLFVVVGGDGTLLYEKEGRELPVFGIGGKTSRICQANAKDWKPKLSRLLPGFSIERRAMLSCEIGGRKVESALNDVVVRSRDFHMVRLSLHAGGRARSFRADGIIFSTPTGSTAYNYACGGKVLPPGARKIAIAAIAPHLRELPPLAVLDSRECAAVVDSGSAQAVIDGQFPHPVVPGERVAVKRSSRDFGLAVPPHQNRPV